MIGKPVPAEELQAVLSRRAEKDRLINVIEAELREIKPGECLVYEARKGEGAMGNLGLTSLITKIKIESNQMLRAVFEGDKTYVYLEK
jgi:hypothetical protein